MYNEKLERKLGSLLLSGKISERSATLAREFFYNLDLNNPKQSQTTFISPEIALILLHMSGGNRALSASYITRYEQDLVSGNFHIGDSSWIIDEDFNLTNGHHRAYAIVSCGVGTEQGIRIGVEKKEAKLCDIQRNRSVLDTIVMSDDIEKKNIYTKTNFSVARIALTYGKSSYGITWTKISQKNLPSIIDMFKEEFEFFGDDFGEVIHSGISAVFLKAYPYFKAEGREQELKTILSAFKKGEDVRRLFDMQDAVPNKEAIKTLIVLHKHATRKYSGKGKRELGGTVEKNQFFRTSNLLYSYFIGQDRSNDNTRENDEFKLREDVREFCNKLKQNIVEETTGQIGFKHAIKSVLDVLPSGEYTFSSIVQELLKMNPHLSESMIRKEFYNMKKKIDVDSLVIQGKQLRIVQCDMSIPSYNAPKSSKYAWMNASLLSLSLFKK